MWRHCFPRKGWTSCYCSSKLVCKFVTAVRGIGVVIGGDDGVVVGVVCFVC